MSASFALLLFITGIPLAVYADQWDKEIDAADDEDIKDTLERIPPALRAASVSEPSGCATHLPSPFSLLSYSTVCFFLPTCPTAGILLHFYDWFHCADSVDGPTSSAGLVQAFQPRQPRHMRHESDFFD